MMHFIQPGLLHLFAFRIDLFRMRCSSEVLKKNRNHHCLGLNNTITTRHSIQQNRWVTRQHQQANPKQKRHMKWSKNFLRG